MLRRVNGGSADYVSADFCLGMTLAAEHLIRLGHKRIAFVGGARQVTPARDRAKAFREILPRFGLPVGPIVNCLPTREGGMSAIGELFGRQAHAPTAILCHNDLCALGVMLGLADRGLVPGRDVAVIGFDNIPEGAMSRPALSTVALGARAIGEEAVAPPSAPYQVTRRSPRKHHPAAEADHPLELRRKRTTMSRRSAGLAQREEDVMTRSSKSQALLASVAIAFGAATAAPAFADAVADAKAAVAKYAGPQTTWEGPTKAPKPEKGKKVVFLSGDEQNDISHLYGVYIKEAGQKTRLGRDYHRR